MDRRIIVKKLEIIRQRCAAEKRPFDRYSARIAEYLEPGKYTYEGDWTDVQGVSRWPAGKTVFLRFDLDVPGEWESDSAYLVFEAKGLEGLLSIDGAPYAGIDANHDRMLINKRGRVACEIEFVSLLRALCDPSLEKESSELREIRLELIDRRVQTAWYDLLFAWEAGQAVQDTYRRERALKALEAALLSIDLTLPDSPFVDSIVGAGAILADELRQISIDPESFRVFLAGHTHIDTAWLWPLAETVRKCGGSFSTACRLMERYPEYHFSCSQPQLYAYTKDHFPSLYEEIKGWVRQGRWETTGGMWVESDCNIPSGESLIRQALFGIEFFQKEFGTRPRTCWLPDVFGYPGNLPQILKGCGFNAFFTIKLNWQARNTFPNNLFWWEGVDGTRIMAHIPRLQRNCNGRMKPEELVFAEQHFSQKAIYREVLMPFGYGDGGGGPTEEMLEFAERAERFPGLPLCRQGTEEAYFKDVKRAKPDLPIWKGELYLETHRGTLTSQARTKKANHESQRVLRDAEILSWMAQCGGERGDASETEVARRETNEAWKNLLKLQFHDILPGSSIGQVYREAESEYSRIIGAGRAGIQRACSIIEEHIPAADVIVFNTLSWQRNDPVMIHLDSDAPTIELVDSEGRTGMAQRIGRSNGGYDYMFAPPSVPLVGYETYAVKPSDSHGEGETASSLRVSLERMENRFFLLHINEQGEITRLLDKRVGREVIPDGERANRLQLFQDGPEREAAWNVHATFEMREYPFEGDSSVTVMDQGPVRGSLRVSRQHRDTRITQDIVLYDSMPRIDFVTRVDWRERQVLLKAAFPIAVHSPRATYEIQFGAIERPTHRNTSWDQEKFEVPCQRWADLSEAGYGVSLMNDCKYGYDIKDNVMRLSLLRGPEWPDPEADLGEHEFTYSIYAHEGSWQEAGTVKRAWELNAPLLGCASKQKSPLLGESAGPSRHSFLNLKGDVVLQAIKPAEDGKGWIVRSYEPHGGRGRAEVEFSEELEGVWECNCIEEPVEAVDHSEHGFAFDFQPFQIRTFRFETTGA